MPGSSSWSMGDVAKAMLQARDKSSVTTGGGEQASPWPWERRVSVATMAPPKITDNKGMSLASLTQLLEQPKRRRIEAGSAVDHNAKDAVQTKITESSQALTKSEVEKIAAG